MNRRIKPQPDVAAQQRKIPRLPGGFSLPPFGLHQWLALVIVCIALWVVGLMWLGLQAGASWTQGWQQDMRFHVYMEKHGGKVNNERLGELADKLEALPGVAAVRIVPLQESRDWLNQWLGDVIGMTDELLASLPAAVEVSPGTGSGEFLYDDLSDIARSLGASVNRGEAYLVQAQRLMGRLHNLLWFGTLVMAMAMVIIISNTLRMILLARTDEIQLMRLLGAGEWFVRLPFLLEGGILGAGAGGLAWVLLWPPLMMVGGWLANLDIVTGVWVLLLPMLLGGALVGGVGAMLATMQIATENTASA